MRKGRLTGAAIAVALSFGVAAVAAAQDPAGDVRRVEGTAAVTRTTAPQGVPLKAKDNVFLRDLVSTGEQSKAQLLLGGKATVTMREQSVLRITEVPGVSTVEITGGLLKLAVNKDRMKPGDRIDVKSPNAITAVRGTTIVVEVTKTPAGPTTRLSVLSGFVEITPIDPITGAPKGPPVRVNDLQQTTVAAGGAPSPPQPINRPDAVKLDASFNFKLSPTATGDDLLKRQVEQAASDASKVRDASKLPGTGTGDTGTSVSGDDIRSRNVPLPAPPPPTRVPSVRGN
jgi:ferric-dicitrate binding protein FerR (iron transport regulator)